MSSKEANAAVFAAAAVTYMAENPHLFPADWSAEAKTNKAGIISLATKVNPADDGRIEQQSPADVLKRLQLSAGPTTPSRKRKATNSFIDEDDDSDNRVYQSAPRFSGDNPFASPAKKSAAAVSSNKADPTIPATTFEHMEYFKGVATFMSKFGGVADVHFDPECRAMRHFAAGQPPCKGGTVGIAGERVPVVLLYDKGSTGGLVPCVLAHGLIRAVSALQQADPENLTDKTPVSFALHALLHMWRDFGLVKLRHSNDGSVDQTATALAWKNKFSAGIAQGWKDTTSRRIAGLVEYVQNHGIVKCHALTDAEVDLITEGISDDAVDSFWGPGLRGLRTGGNPDDIE